jgi:hypothetical protein
MYLKVVTQTCLTIIVASSRTPYFTTGIVERHSEEAPTSPLSSKTLAARRRHPQPLFSSPSPEPLPPSAPPRCGRLGGLSAAGGVLVGSGDRSVVGMVRSGSRQDRSGGALDRGMAVATSTSSTCCSVWQWRLLRWGAGPLCGAFAASMVGVRRASGRRG